MKRDTVHQNPALTRRFLQIYNQKGAVTGLKTIKKQQQQKKKKRAWEGRQKKKQRGTLEKEIMTRQGFNNS